MASGEPSDFVKKTIATKFAGGNIYAPLDDLNELDDNDQGGGAPLYSPTEDSDQDGGAPLYSPTVTDKTDGDSISTHHTSDSPEQARNFLSYFQIDGAGRFVNPYKIPAATPAQPVVTPANAQAGQAQGCPVTSVRKDNLSAQKSKQYTDMEKEGRFAAANTGPRNNVYGRNGGHNGGNNGNHAHPGAYQMLQQQHQQNEQHMRYYQDYRPIDSGSKFISFPFLSFPPFCG